MKKLFNKITHSLGDGLGAASEGIAFLYQVVLLLTSFMTVLGIVGPLAVSLLYKSTSIQILLFKSGERADHITCSCKFSAGYSWVTGDAESFWIRTGTLRFNVGLDNRVSTSIYSVMLILEKEKIQRWNEYIGCKIDTSQDEQKKAVGYCNRDAFSLTWIGDR